MLLNLRRSYQVNLIKFYSNKHAFEDFSIKEHLLTPDLSLRESTDIINKKADKSVFVIADATAKQNQITNYLSNNFGEITSVIPVPTIEQTNKNYLIEFSSLSSLGQLQNQMNDDKLINRVIKLSSNTKQKQKNYKTSNEANHVQILHKDLLHQTSIADQMKVLVKLIDTDNADIFTKFFIRSIINEVTVKTKLASRLFIKTNLYGSTLSGCGQKSSDVDISITSLKNKNKDFLKDIGTMLHEHLPLCVNFEYIPGANVPLFKFMFKPLELDVDISVSQEAWASNNNLLGQGEWNDKFTSFLLTSTILFYLMRLRPAGLPNFEFIIENRVNELNLGKHDLEDLLIGYFKYYSSYEFYRQAIDLRKGTIKRSHSIVHIKNPFKFQNMSQNCSHEYIEQFQNCCEESYTLLRKNRKPQSDTNWGLCLLFPEMNKKKKHVS